MHCVALHCTAGIMHVIERHDHGSVRVYRHFAFRFAAEPPFAIDALSDELNLRFNETFRVGGARLWCMRRVDWECVRWVMG